MSIASEISRLYGVRSDIFDAIEAKGVTVPGGSKLDDCPSLIAAITGGGGGGDIYNVIDYADYAAGSKNFDVTDGILTYAVDGHGLTFKQVNLSSFDEIVFKTKIKYNCSLQDRSGFAVLGTVSNSDYFMMLYYDSSVSQNYLLWIATGENLGYSYPLQGTDSTTFNSLSTLEIRMKKSTGAAVVKINDSVVCNISNITPYYGSNVILRFALDGSLVGTASAGDQVYLKSTYLIADGNYLIGQPSSAINGYEVKMIAQLAGIYLVDRNGYIGLDINDYVSQNGSPYPGNYAVVLNGADFSAAGLGRVTFLEFGSENIGGRVYKTVTIGGVTWMAENLDWKAPGITIGSQSYSDSVAMANYYNNDEETYGVNGNKYGLLYNWPAAMSLTVAGWHLPTYEEWDALYAAVGSTTTPLRSTTGWNSTYNGTDLYGFKAFPAGYKDTYTYQGVGEKASFWTSSDNGTAWKIFRQFSGSNVYDKSQSQARIVRSIRLVKDAPGDALTPYEDHSLYSYPDATGRDSVQNNEFLSLFVVVRGVTGRTIRSFDVYTNQDNAATGYQSAEPAAVEFSSFDFLNHDPSIQPGTVTATPYYASSWTRSSSVEFGSCFKQHIVLDNPIVMQDGKQYAFIVTTRGDSDRRQSACSSLVPAQNLMLSGAEFYSSGQNEITFSWYEANKYCFAGTHAPSIKFYDTV